LVVSDPADGREVGDLLAQAGFEDVRRSSGGDGSIELLAELGPSVVVLAASLTDGDARALAAAIKRQHRTTRIVLVGDAAGPIRNALDAADFEVDHVVARPLSVTTLGAAVARCAALVASPPPASAAPELDRAMEDAIASFVDEAMSALGIGEPRRSSGEAARAIATATTEVLPPLREPTLILSGGGAAVAPVAVPAVPTPPAAAPVSSSTRPSGAPDDDEPARLDADPTRRRASSWTHPTAPGSGSGARLSGLGVEMRQKISEMAERLFPGRGDRPWVHGGPTHDAHTDIDLASIGADRTDPTADLPVDNLADTNPLAGELEPTASDEITSEEDTVESIRRRRSTSGELPARADLAVFDVGFLFARLWSRGFTGRIEFRRAGVEKIVQFEDGRPVFATSNLPHDRMGDLLFREGKITPEQHRHARELVIESGRRMGESLVELGFIKPRELLPTVRRHLEDVVYSLFAWDDGEFSATAGEPTGERIRLARHPAALVLEGVRRKYDEARLRGRLGTAAAVVAARPTRQLAALISVADLALAERALVGKLDGHLTLEAAAAAAEVELLPAMQLAFVLVALGVAEVVDRGLGDEPPAIVPRGPSLIGETDLAIDRLRIMTKHALVEESDYFMLLGVRRDATAFEIRRAYEAAKRDFAAESFPAELQRDLAVELGEINHLIAEAFQVLRDERMRGSYLAHLVD
jgi:DNA-binding NarL/FixJ family response regulator